MPAPDDIYKKDVDFTTLAMQYHAFSKKLKTNGQLDFSDPESVRQLTKALLHRDFRLTIDLPADRLCPPVPNRFNYILFAQRLIDSTHTDYTDGYSPSQRTLCLDIGTGASAIYPLLGCQQRPSWYFLATEIDHKSRSYAERNIKANDLESRIKILDTDLTGQEIIPSAKFGGLDNYGIRIQMVNPPFYSSETDMVESAKQKSRPPNSACTGAPVEMIVEGGEVQFVLRLLKESNLPQNRRKIQWFSSMLGKLSSVDVIVEQLRQMSCSNYAVTEFIQGQRTRRWCIAWSWSNLRPPTSVARGIPSLDKRLLPFPSDFSFDLVNQDVAAIGKAIDFEITKLDLQWQCSTKMDGGIGRSMTGDVWSRKARRKKLRDEDMNDMGEEGPSSSEDESEPSLAFRIDVRAGTNQTTVTVRWLQGQDSVIFESFCGWLKRKLASADS